MKLISMTEFVLEQKQKFIELGKENYDNSCIVKSFDLVLNYAEFLRQTLTLGMFVPVDEDGDPFCLPLIKAMNDEFDRAQYENLEKVKYKILFEGFEISSLNTVLNTKMGLTIYLDTYQFLVEDSLGIGGGDIWGKTIEALANTNLEIELTPSALKQIGLNN